MRGIQVLGLVPGPIDRVYEATVASMGPLLWYPMARGRHQVTEAPGSQQSFKGQAEAGKEPSHPQG